MAQRSVRRGRENQGSVRSASSARKRLGPDPRTPYRPAACNGRISRPDTRKHLTTRHSPLQNLLASSGASTHGRHQGSARGGKPPYARTAESRLNRSGAGALRDRGKQREVVCAPVGLQIWCRCKAPVRGSLGDDGAGGRINPDELIVLRRLRCRRRCRLAPTIDSRNPAAGRRWLALQAAGEAHPA